MRKVLSGIVIIAMIITIFPACLFAAEKVVVTSAISNNKPSAGDEVTVKVRFENLKDVMSIEGYINIDEHILEPITTSSIATVDGKNIMVDDRKVEVVDTKDIEDFYTKSEEAFYLNTEPFSENDNKFIIDLTKKVSGNVEFTVKFRVKPRAHEELRRNAIQFNNLIVGKSDGTQLEFSDLKYDLTVVKTASIGNIELALNKDTSEVVLGQVFPVFLQLKIYQDLFKFNTITADVDFDSDAFELFNYTGINDWQATLDNNKLTLDISSDASIRSVNIFRMMLRSKEDKLLPGDTAVVALRNIKVGMKGQELTDYPEDLVMNIKIVENTAGEISDPVIEISEIDGNKIRVVSSDEVGLYSVEYFWNNDIENKCYASANGHKAVQFDIDRPTEDAILTIKAVNIEERAASLSQKIEKAIYVAPKTEVPAEESNKGSSQTQTQEVVGTSVDKTKKNETVGEKTEATVGAVDDTISKSRIPETGLKHVIPVILLVFTILSLVIYRKYNYLSKIF